jgi:hypothetical protein
VDDGGHGWKGEVMTNGPEGGRGTTSAAELRLTSDEFLQRLDRLYELETRKREIKPDDAEFARLAREVEDTARALLGVGEHQTHLADESIERAKQDPGNAIETPIRELPRTRRDATAVLADWRAAERYLATAAPGSDDERKARGDVERLRGEYRDITDLSRYEPERRMA